MEALLRWRHPTRGLVSPVEFIPLAEETGLIRPIGRWVLEQACQQAKLWHATHPSLLVSVNLSGRQIQQPDELIEMVSQVLTKTGVDPGVIQLEITESVLMDDTRANISTLNRLKALGVRLAIDDFGTGYSSLSYLKWFPVDSIKIDRAFISGIATDIENRAVVKAVLGLGSDLALSVVAEGVENTEELDHLSSLGCRFTQGYYFARPMPSTEANKLLDQGLLPPPPKTAEVKPVRVINLGSDDLTFHFSAI
jgi:EAL domain-containing protein (putative c-di-GMP-specific phosphodiesterase class I)